MSLQCLEFESYDLISPELGVKLAWCANCYSKAKFPVLKLILHGRGRGVRMQDSGEESSGDIYRHECIKKVGQEWGGARPTEEFLQTIGLHLNNRGFQITIASKKFDSLHRSNFLDTPLSTAIQIKTSATEQRSDQSMWSVSRECRSKIFVCLKVGRLKNDL